MTEHHATASRFLSIILVFSMVVTGFLVLVPLAPVPSTEAQGGSMASGADGEYGDGSDILLVMDYMYYYANPNSATDSYYGSLKPLVSSIQEAGFTVDEWKSYPFIYNGYCYCSNQRAAMPFVPGEYVYNYYPWDSLYGDDGAAMSDYHMIIIYGRGSYHLGMYYNYDRVEGATYMRTLDGLGEYLDNGGNVWMMNYYGGYSVYYPYSGSSNRAAAQAWYREYMDITTDYNYHYGYSVRGIDAECPITGRPSVGIDPRTDSIFKFEYPDNYCYHYYYQKPYSDSAFGCWEGSYSYDTYYSPTRYAAIQSRHDWDFNTIYFMWDPFHVRYYNPGTGYGYYPAVAREEDRNNVVEAVLGTMMTLCTPCSWKGPVLVEVSDYSGNEFFEFYHDGYYPLDLSEYFITVAQTDPADPSKLIWDPENRPFCNMTSLESFDPDGDGFLEYGETLVVDDSLEPDGDDIPGSGMVAFIDKDGYWEPQYHSYGWGACGPALNPVFVQSESWSTQLYHYSGSARYSSSAQWTIGPATKGIANTGLTRPALGMSDVVINEVVPGTGGYIELYNRGTEPKSIAGWWLAVGDRKIDLSGTMQAGDFLSVYAGADLNPLRDNPALFDDVNTLVCQIGWDDGGIEPGKAVARHLDGFGTDSAHNTTLATIGKANSNNELEPVEMNLRWDFNVDPTDGSTNYDGIKTLVNTEDLKDLIASIPEGATTKPYAGGVVKASYDSLYLGNFDVVFATDSAISSVEARLLLDYIHGGGRLYLACNDIDTGIASEALRSLLGVSVNNGRVMVHDIDVTFEELDGTMKGVGVNVQESYETGTNSFPLLHVDDTTIGAFTVGDDAESAHRIIVSGLDILFLDDAQITVDDYLSEVMHWFTKDNINHAPVIELDADLLETGDDVRKFRYFADDFQHCIRWDLIDNDPWDKITDGDPYTYRNVQFDVYISSSIGKVATRSTAAYRGTTNRTYFVPQIEESGHYYCNVVARDRYGATGMGPEIGQFLFDNEAPVVEWVRPVFLDHDEAGTHGEKGSHDETGAVTRVLVGNDIDDSIADGSGPESMSYFGCAYPGTPDLIAMKLTDNNGLKMAGNAPCVVDVRCAEPDRFVEFYEYVVTDGSIHSKFLYNDFENRTVNLSDPLLPYDERLELNGKQEIILLYVPVSEYLESDELLPAGDYEIDITVRDGVANSAVRTARFSVDLQAPRAAHSFDIETKHYVGPTGEIFVRTGEPNSISFRSITNSDDPSLERVELQMSHGIENFDIIDNPFTEEKEARNWMTMKTWNRTEMDGIEDRQYHFIWMPSTQYDSIRVVSWDRAGNWNVSQVFTDFTVDGFVPFAPSNLDWDIVDGRITIEGKTKDRHGGSGVSYVEVFLNDREVPIPVTDEYHGAALTIAPRVNELGYFKVSFDLDPVGYRGNDVRNEIRIRAVDRVGNTGPLTEKDAIPPVRLIRQGISEHTLVVEFKPGRETVSSNQLRQCSLVINSFRESDNISHPLTMEYTSGKPEGLPGGVKWIDGMWRIQCDYLEEGTGFSAALTFDYFLKQSSQVIEEDLILLYKMRKNDPWEDAGALQTIDDELGEHQLFIDDLNTLNGYYAIIAGCPNLYIEEMMFNRCSALTGQNVPIHITIGNDAPFARRAGSKDSPVTAQVTAAYIDHKGIIRTLVIAEAVNFGMIDPGTVMTRSVIWNAPLDRNKHGRQIYTLTVRIDRDNYIDETDETDNTYELELSVVPKAAAVPSMDMTRPLVVLSVCMIAGLVCALRRRFSRRSPDGTIRP